MTDLESRAAALRQIAGSVGEDAAELNEAATRVQLVDQILERVLGWPRSQFHPEEYGGLDQEDQKKQWLDYHLGQPERPRLVVEAKRVGKTFSLSTRRTRQVSLGQLQSHNGKLLKEVLNQARRYCRTVGTLGFVVTNGYQWVASHHFVPGVPEANIQAVVFYDLDDIVENLVEFVELLSPEGLSAQTLAGRAGAPAARTPTFAKSIVQVVRGSSSPKDRNYLIGPMRLIIRECFHDLTRPDQAQLLHRCYVPTDATDETLKLLETFAGSSLPDSLPLDTTKVNRDDRGGTTLAEHYESGTTVLVVGRA